MTSVACTIQLLRPLLIRYSSKLECLSLPITFFKLKNLQTRQASFILQAPGVVRSGH
jgi:hypothetical protein